MCWYLHELAEQGELYRRWLGYEPGQLPLDDEFQRSLPPLDVTRAKAAIMEAIVAGFDLEEDEGKKEVNLGLLELEKKTGEN